MEVVIKEGSKVIIAYPKNKYECDGVVIAISERAERHDIFINVESLNRTAILCVYK